jgi:phosphoserine aminotransferase
MRKVYNFSAGPGMLPEEVMATAQEEMLDWHNTGSSIMELGHRGLDFATIIKDTEADLRELMNIPRNYKVLFVTGGATAQFAMVPMNLMSDKKRADYVVTGVWGKKAMEEAMRFGDIEMAAQSVHRNHLLAAPLQEEWELRDNIDYIHYVANETIDGLEFNFVPKVTEVPLVCDMSSMILSRPVEVSKYGLIYAGAQKNMGQAGITVVIIRDDLIKNPVFLTPTLYQYQTHAVHHSLYNTPPTYSWYMLGLVLKWVKRHGGISAFYEINKRKAKKLYDTIDASHGFYESRIHPSSRSLMNVIFGLPSEELDELFVTEAAKQGLTNLKGHRVVGGIRASIYNAMPEAGVDALVKFMQEFAAKYAKG